MATLYGIASVIVLAQTGSNAEAQYFAQTTQAENQVPFYLTVVGFAFTIVMLLIWIIIILFDLSVDCDDRELSWSQNRSLAENILGGNLTDVFDADAFCPPYPVGLVTTIVLANLISAYAGWHATSLVAKLYQARAKMSTHLADDLVKSWSKDIAGTWTINPKPDEIWKKLSKYFEKFPDSAHPLCFKEYLIRGANAGELSYSADKAVDKMFDHLVAQNLQKQHIAIRSQLKSNERPFDLRDYPDGLEFDEI